MNWQHVRTVHPNQWLVIEAMSARHEGSVYVIDELAVVETCSSGEDAITAYRRLHHQAPNRELLFVHTSRPALEFEERRWAGVRTAS